MDDNERYDGIDRRLTQQSHNWRQLVRTRIHYMQVNGWDVEVEQRGGYPTRITTKSDGKELFAEVRDWREAYAWLDGFLIGHDTPAPRPAPIQRTTRKRK